MLEFECPEPQGMIVSERRDLKEWVMLKWDQGDKSCLYCSETETWRLSDPGKSREETAVQQAEVCGWLRSTALVSDAQSFQFPPHSHKVTPRREISEESQIYWQSARKPPSRHYSGGQKKVVPTEQAQKSVLVSPRVGGLSVHLWASHPSSWVCDSLGQLLPVTDVGLAWPLV